MESLLKRLTFLLLGLAFIGYSAGTAQAVDVLQVCDKRPDAAICKDKNPGSNPIYGQDGILTEIINIISILIGIAAVIMIIMGGLKLITSGSNPQDVSSAREMIIYAAVGLIVAGLAQVLVRFILSKL
jgi:hypothetical protein